MGFFLPLTYRALRVRNPLNRVTSEPILAPSIESCITKHMVARGLLLLSRVQARLVGHLQVDAAKDYQY